MFNDQETTPASALINAETARLDLERWLNGKKISRHKREEAEKNKQLDYLACEIEDGYLTVEADGTLKQKLRFPTAGEAPITHISYKSRINIGTVEAIMKREKAEGALQTIRCYAQAITGLNGQIINKLDDVDISLMQTITGFFM